MTPEVPVPVTSPEIEEAAETVEEAAVTLDEVSEAIEAGALANHEALAELIREVRECRTMIQTLSTSGATESPSIQQLLIQVAEIQGKVDRIQAELLELRPSEPEPENVNPEEISGENGSSPRKKNGESGTGSGRESGERKSGEQPEPNPKPPESSPSPTPEKKRRYIKL